MNKTTDQEIISLALATVLLALRVSADAQQPTKRRRIGLLYASASVNAPQIAAFRLGMRELGYVEGKTLLLRNDMPRENSNGFLCLLRSWCDSKIDLRIPLNVLARADRVIK
jgi:hypothetical protein